MAFLSLFFLRLCFLCCPWETGGHAGWQGTKSNLDWKVKITNPLQDCSRLVAFVYSFPFPWLWFGVPERVVSGEEEVVVPYFSWVERTEVQPPHPCPTPGNAPKALPSTFGDQRETGTWESGLGVPSPKLEEQCPEAAPLNHLTARPLQPPSLSLLLLLHLLFPEPLSLALPGLSHKSSCCFLWMAWALPGE